MTEKGFHTGQVDHYIPKGPKAKAAKLVYDWNNLIWSCKDCNLEKKEIYEPDNLLLNPCNEADTELVYLNEDTGCYHLKKEDHERNRKRYQSTRDATCMNAQTRLDQRRHFAKAVRLALDDLKLAREINNGESPEPQEFQDFKDLMDALGYRSLARRIYEETEFKEQIPFEQLITLPQ